RLQAAEATAKPRATTPAAFHVMGASLFRAAGTSYTAEAGEATSDALVVDDPQEGLGLQARAPDERAVHVGLRHEAVDVVGLDAATMSSLSAKMCLRSEWPRMTWLQPTCFSIAGEISPVKAPSRSQCMFWAPSKTSLPRNASATAARAVKGGATSTSRSFSGRARPARMSWASATPSGSVLYIF